MVDVVVDLPGELRYGSDLPSAISTSPGGSGANVAAWIASLGGQASVFGVVGDDEWGDVLLNHLESYGANCFLRKEPSLPTGMVVALVHPGGERTMFPDSRANSALAIEDFANLDWSEVDWLYLSGYVFYTRETTEVAEWLATQARAAGVRVAIDPASSGPIADQAVADLRNWFDLADLLLPNESEAQTIERLLAAPIASLCPTVAVKRGPLGVELWQAGDRLEMPALPAEVVDTVGAGDAFAGGLLSALAEGQPMVDACSVGLKAASLAVATRGAQPPTAAF